MNKALVIGGVMMLAVAIMLIWTRVDMMTGAERARAVGVTMALWLCCGAPLLAFGGGWAAHALWLHRRPQTFGKEL